MIGKGPVSEGLREGDEMADTPESNKVISLFWVPSSVWGKTLTRCVNNWIENILAVFEARFQLYVLTGWIWNLCFDTADYSGQDWSSVAPSQTGSSVLSTKCERECVVVLFWTIQHLIAETRMKVCESLGNVYGDGLRFGVKFVPLFYSLIFSTILLGFDSFFCIYCKRVFQALCCLSSTFWADRLCDIFLLHNAALIFDIFSSISWAFFK